jgi:hypothetical protein
LATDSLSEDVTDIREVRNKEEESFSYLGEKEKAIDRMGKESLITS